MARFRSMVFVSCMLALLSAVGAIKISDEYAERLMTNSSNCNVTGTIGQFPEKLWLKESNQIFVCKPCRMKYQTYFNCSKCSITDDPVCDDQSLRKLNKNYLRNPSQRFPPNDYLPLISQLILFKTNASLSQMEDMFHRNLIYTIYAISHSPFFTFLIDNCGSSSKHFNKFEVNLMLRAMKTFKMEFSKLFSLEKYTVKMLHKPHIADKQETDEIDEILHMLCDSEVVNKKLKRIKRSLNGLNGTESRLSPSRQRREFQGYEQNDHLFRITNTVSEPRKEKSTTRLYKKYKHRSEMEDTVTAKSTTKHFRRTGKQSAGKKHTHRVRGKKLRDFGKNLKHNNGSINFHAHIKSSDLNKGSHLNKTVLHEQVTTVGWKLNDTSGDDRYEESDKVNGTYVKSKNGVSLSENSRDILASSSFSSHMDYIGSTEIPSGMSSSYYQQFSEQTSQNSLANDETQLNISKGIIPQDNNERYKDGDSIEHDFPSQLEYGKTVKLVSSFELSSTAENSRMRSSFPPNDFPGFTRPNDKSPDFPVDPDMPRSDAFKYRKDMKTAETLSGTLEEVKGTVSSFLNLEYDGVKNIDIFKNMSSSVTDEQLAKMNSSITSEEKIIVNGMGVHNHTDRKFLVTSFDQSGSNYVTAQHLLNNASSGRSTNIGEAEKKNSAETVNNFENMPLGNISEEQEGLKNLLPSAQDKNDDVGNTNYTSREDHSKTVSTIPSSLREHEFSHTTENKIRNNTENGELIAINVKERTDIENVASELQKKPEEMVHSTTSRENENRDMDIGNSRNITDSSLSSFTRNGTEKYSTDSGVQEYKLKENQTLVTSQIKENFPVATSNVPDEQQQNSTSNTFIEKGNYTNDGNFRHKRLNFIPTNRNDSNQTPLETSEHTLVVNKANETNTTYNALENVESHMVNNTSDELNGSNRVSEGHETSHRDNLYRSFNGNENKGLSYSYERVTKSDNSNHMFNLSSTVLPFISGELNRKSSKESISGDVGELNDNMFKDSEIQKTLSGHSLDHTNTHGPHDYRTTKDEDNGFKNSTTVIHDNTTLDRNEATVKVADRVDNGMVESYNPESITSNIRYKRDQPVTEIGSKSIQINKHIPKKSVRVLRSLLNFSDLEKNEEMLNIGTNKTVEKANKETLKSKKLRKKYQSQTVQCVGLCKNVNESSTVTQTFKEDHNEHPKSMKAKQTSNGHSKHTVKKQLKAYSPDYEEKHQSPHTLKNLTESTKHNLPASESGENTDMKRMLVKQNLQNSYTKDILLDKANGKKIEGKREENNGKKKEFVDSKFRTGRKLLYFSVTDDKKVIVKRFGTALSFRRQRSVKDFPENSWCNFPDGLNFKRIDCTVWTYQKKCLMSCNDGNNVQGAKETIFTCTRKKNVWEPKVQSCVDGEGKVGSTDLKGYQPVNDNNIYPEDSKKAMKSQATPPPSDYNVSDYYEYEDYQYQEDEGNRLQSDKKSGGQKWG